MTWELGAQLAAHAAGFSEALVAFEAWDILNKPEPEEPPITPCVNDPEGTRKNKKGELVGDHFCDKRVKKCMTMRTSTTSPSLSQQCRMQSSPHWRLACCCSYRSWRCSCP